MSNQMEEMGIIVRADGTVELANGMKLTAEQISAVGKALDAHGQKLAQTEKGQKAVAETAKDMGKELADAGEKAVEVGKAVSDRRWMDAAKNVGELAAQGRELSTAMLLGGGTVAGVILAAGALAVAAAQGAAEERKLNDALILTGDYAGLVRGQLDEMASGVAASINGNVAASRNVLAQLVTSGRFTAESIGAVGQAIQLVARFSGQTEKEVSQHFAKLADEPVKTAAKLNESFHFLSIETFRYVQALEEQGRKQEAARVVSVALSDHLGNDLTRNLGTLDRTLQSVTDSWSRMWAAAKNIGKEDGPEARVRKAGLAVDQARLNLGGNFGGTPAERQAALNAAIANFDKEMDTWIAAQKAATAKSDKAVATEDEMKRSQAWKRITEQNLTRQEQMAKALKEARDAGTARGVGEDDIQREEAKIRARYAEKPRANIGEAYLDQLQRQYRGLTHDASAYADALEFIERNTAKLSPALRRQIELEAKQVDQARAKKVVDAAEMKYLEEVAAAREKATNVWLDQEAAARQDRSDREFEISLLGKTTEQIARLTMARKAEQDVKARRATVLDDFAEGRISGETATARLDAIDQNAAQKMVDTNALLADKFKPGWQKMIDGWGDSMQMMRDAHSNSMSSIVQGGEEMWVQLVTTGKVNAKSLVNGVLAEMARLQYRQNIAGPLASFANGFLGNLFGTNYGGAGITGGGGFGTGKIFGNEDMGQFLFSKAHTGGVVGSSRLATGWASPAVFANAPRFHGGGVAGDEVPIIAKKGEGIFTKEQMANLQPAGATSTITYAPQISIDARTDRAEVYDLVSRAVRAGQADLLDQMKRGTV